MVHVEDVQRHEVLRRGADHDGLWIGDRFAALPASELPLALARAHGALRPRGVIGLLLACRRELDPTSLRARLHGAGFERIRVEYLDADWVYARATRARTLPDFLRPGLRLLVCGLNPSLYSADAGVPFARPQNRFWVAARRSGLVARERDVEAALARGVGFTDCVKRATVAARELDTSEYVRGLARVAELARCFRPGAVCFVGLDAWRRAVNRRASPGWIPGGFADGAAYLMPSTSGLNTHADVASLARHLARAGARNFGRKIRIEPARTTRSSLDRRNGGSEEGGDDDMDESTGAEVRASREIAEEDRDRMRWRGVLERDPTLDGAFVYAVDSTGIYCRPTCPSRRARREHVRFFATPAEAVAAGYRACRRCHPERSAAASPSAKVIAAVEYIEAQARIPTLAELGRHVGLSPAHLQRAFKSAVGVTPRQYATARRVVRLKTRLREGDTILRALYASGYGSTSRLYESASEELGMTPATYRRGGRGLAMRYATATTALGPLLIAATDRGVAHVALGSSVTRLEQELRREFPAARLRRADRRLQRWLGRVVTWLAGEAPWPRLPLDVRATAFQRRVWQAIRSIPEGSTLTYGELARRAGRPQAARAVARACATNPAALVVPCHRVVRSDGGIGGYRWGGARKRALLETEARRRTLE